MGWFCKVAKFLTVGNKTVLRKIQNGAPHAICFYRHNDFISADSLRSGRTTRRADNYGYDFSHFYFNPNQSANSDNYTSGIPASRRDKS
jgi:hypothetical protein